MDDSKLRALLTAVQCGSFGKAAAQLGYTQSAMTHLVSKLEAELGCTLLLRSSKGVCLSEEGERLLPYVRRGDMLYLSIPGMACDCHDNLPACLLKSWTPEQLDYMHDITWWRAMIEPTPGVEIVSMQPMLCTNEAWEDWLACNNEYAAGDRAAVEAGALKYLNTIAIVLRKF